MFSNISKFSFDVNFLSINFCIINATSFVLFVNNNALLLVLAVLKMDLRAMLAVVYVCS